MAEGEKRDRTVVVSNGIGDGLPRLSVGLEDTRDLIEGLDRGLAAA